MSRVTITRMALLARKEQIALAEQGLELLRQKRGALLRELMQTAQHVLAQRDTLEELATAARRALALATGLAGEPAVRSAALAARGEVSLAIYTAHVMGVSVPQVEQKPVMRALFGRGYAPIGTSATIDEAAAAYETELDHLIRLADSELRLQRLAAEIQRTTRRANALEHVILPRLRAERDQIEMALEEREREAYFRLKRIKKGSAEI